MEDIKAQGNLAELNNMSGEEYFEGLIAKFGLAEMSITELADDRNFSSKPDEEDTPDDF